MKKKMYSKPEAVVVAMTPETLLAGLSGEHDVIDIPDGGDADDGMEAQANDNGGFNLWTDDEEW